jgi:hypothetical protein
MNEIKFPSVPTYFITYQDINILAYGVVLPDQEMVSGLPFLYQTTNKSEWILELSNYNYYVGYQFNFEEDAEDAKTDVNNYYGPNTCNYEYAQYNDPEFWYIIGDYTDVLGEPIPFKLNQS